MRTTPDWGDSGWGLSYWGLASQPKRYSMTKEYPKLIDERNAKNADKKQYWKWSDGHNQRLLSHY